MERTWKISSRTRDIARFSIFALTFSEFHDCERMQKGEKAIAWQIDLEICAISFVRVSQKLLIAGTDIAGCGGINQAFAKGGFER